jgi:hypothetical protein
MTSLRQIEANRRNALRSTGPITEAGKLRSRQNAVRHGLCAETVIGVLEDTNDYRGFEASIIADFNAETTVERELVLRLASLLWRIRRTVTIEAALFRREAQTLQEERLDHFVAYGDGPIEHPGSTAYSANPSADLADSFQRLVTLNGATVEQLRRYERSLSRQISQTLSLLRHASRCHHAAFRNSRR